MKNSLFVLLFLVSLAVSQAGLKDFFSFGGTSSDLVSAADKIKEAVGLLETDTTRRLLKYSDPKDTTIHELRRNVDHLTTILESNNIEPDIEPIRDRIRNGERFRMVVYTKVPNTPAIAPHYGYAAEYNGAARTMTVTGLNAIVSKIQTPAPSPCQDLDSNGLTLWGHNFRFDGGRHLIDSQSQVQCGVIYFDSDVEPKSH